MSVTNCDDVACKICFNEYDEDCETESEDDELRKSDYAQRYRDYQSDNRTPY